MRFYICINYGFEIHLEKLDFLMDIIFAQNDD